MKSAVGLCTLALACLLAPPLVVQAQNSKPSTFRYDISREVTYTGTVAGTLPKPQTGMFTGSHLFVATPAGIVDASLGRFRFIGEGAVAVTAGQQVTITGVMGTFRNRQVFFARTVKAGSEVYEIRNEHGFLLSPSAHGNSSRHAFVFGEGQ